MKNINHIILLIVYLFLSYLVFVLFVNDNYYDNSIYRLDADASIYHDVASYSDLTIVNVINFNRNTLGPVLILKLADSNGMVFFVNIFLFVSACLIVVKEFGNDINKLCFIALIVVNPLALASLLTANKEILGFFSIALFACYLESKRYYYLFLSIPFALMTRWHELLVILVFLLLNSRINPFNKSKFKTCILLVLILTVLYPILSQYISFENFVLESQSSTMFGVIDLLNWLQNNYLFFVALIPKILSNLFGNIFRIWYLLTDPNSIDFTDIYNNVFVIGHQIIMFVMLVFMVSLKRIKFNNPLILFAFVYLTIFSLSPLIQYRYIYPLYILLCIELSRVPKHELQDNRLIYD